MISPISFLWRQFSGPQIQAITQAIWQYFRTTYDRTLEYFRTFSLNTATNEHLSLIGIFQGLARPLIAIPEKGVFWFTNAYEYVDDPNNPGHKIPSYDYPSTEGFSSVEEYPNGVGGKFSANTAPGNYRQLPPALFRRILRANSDSDAELGSLKTLDDILFGVWRLNHSAVTPPTYKFTFTNRVDYPRNTPGDIIVDLGMTGDWQYPYETQAEIKLLGKTVYYPIPKLVAEITPGDARADPIGLIRILVHTQDDIYGLDAMWEGVGTPSDVVDDGENPEWSMSAVTTSELLQMWARDNTWIDEEGPSEDFYPLSLEALEDMWNT